ncbi:MAG TPA: hypothetical protein VJO35_11700 [Terriglobales bacterium]|nr:hypothetical protein [Terriglobales bacterium]
MQRNRRLATWIGALLGAFMALLLNSALAHASDDGPLVTEEFHQSYPLTANGRVELQNINGAVHITAWDKNEIKVDAVKSAHSQDQLKRAEIRVDAHSDSVSIETHYAHDDDDWSSHQNPASVEYTVTVPRNARLDEIKLINGELEVADVKGEVRASCINGKLIARGLAGETRLSTINSKLDAEFSKLGSESVDLSSVNGSVDLTLPSDAKASIEANTVHGGIDNDFGLHANNHHWVGHDLRGELAGGGTRIELHNVNGRIDIHHAADGKAISPAKDTGEHQQGSV